MGRTVRQKRKGRSSRPVVKQTNARKRPVNPTGNVIIAQNWDKKLTLTQNYRRLGLMNRLRKPTGGVEKLGTDAVLADAAAAAAGKAAKDARSTDPFAIDPAAGKKAKRGSGAGAGAGSGVREVRVERDASGRIVRIVGEAAPANNPLNDPLNDLEDEEEDEDEDEEGEAAGEWAGLEDDPIQGRAPGGAAKTTPVVAALEKIARQPTAPKHVRHQSAGERAWLQALVDHYGQADPDETTLAAMARDRRRNPFQRTAADLRRRLATFRADGGAVSVSS